MRPRAGRAGETLASIARALGRERSQLSRWRSGATWARDLPLEVEAWRSAIEANSKSHLDRRGAGEGPTAPAAAPPSPSSSLADALRRPGLPAHERAVLVADAALDRLADAIASGKRVVGDVDDAKKALSELRLSATQAREEAEAAGRLVDRDDARAACAAVARVCVEALDRVSMLIAQQVEVWLADEALRAMGSAQRARAVRAWAEEQTSQVRDESAARIERMIEAAREEGSGR